MKRIYMVGIGGISMSALAIFAKEKGFEVFGYDERKSLATQMLENNGIVVDYIPNFQQMSKSDTIVFSSAIKQNNQMFQYAKYCKKNTMSRGEFLGFISQGYEKVVAVAGSHGKTTTTAMIYEILKTAGKEPTLHLGGFKVDDNMNFAIGNQEFFVTEACEYCDNFLNLRPYICVITNIEKEHLDYFKTFENQKRSFEIFKMQSREVVEGEGDLVSRNLVHDRLGRLSFSLYKGSEKIMRLHMKVCEEVNVKNCIYAYQVAKKLGVSDCIIKLGLENFQGVKTRFEKVKCEAFEDVILDYAHHPTELRKAIKSARKIFKNKKLITVFQPHTYSRTKDFLKGFINVFKEVDVPIFFKTYSARENSEQGVSSKELAEKVKKVNKNAIFFENFTDFSKFLASFQNLGVVLLIVGAGDLPDILRKNNFIE